MCYVVFCLNQIANLFIFHLIFCVNIVKIIILARFKFALIKLSKRQSVQYGFVYFLLFINDFVLFPLIFLNFFTLHRNMNDFRKDCLFGEFVNFCFWMKIIYYTCWVHVEYSKIFVIGSCKSDRDDFFVWVSQVDKFLFEHGDFFFKWNKRFATDDYEKLF